MKMKKFNLLLLFALIFSGLLFSQETESPETFKASGNAFGKVFFNYHYDLTKDSEKRNSFELQRTYLGYKYNFSKSISAKITLDGARKSDASSYTVFLKTAQLDWKIANPIKLSVGMIGLKQFDTQEKFWGYRYLFKSFQDEFALGSSADLGVNAEIKIIDNLTANVFVLNGEGYTKVQDNMGRMKAGGNLIYTPVKGLILKGYYDIYGGKEENGAEEAVDTASVHTIAFFAGYGAKKFRIGGEFDIQYNGTKYNEIAADHNMLGGAIYGTYIINKKFEVFAELLVFKTNKVGNATETWNYNKDGNVIVAGAQYSPVKGLKMALNYRSFLYDNPDINTGSFIYLNFEYAF